MSIISADNTSFNAEDSVYLNAAITEARNARVKLQQGEYEQAMKHAIMGCKRVEELYNLRKAVDPNYEILQAPFYFLMANIHSFYMEQQTDEMGILAPLHLEEELDEDEEEEDGLEDPPTQDANEEPRIEEEQQINTKSVEESKGPEEKKEENYSDTAFEESH